MEQCRLVRLFVGELNHRDCVNVELRVPITE